MMYSPYWSKERNKSNNDHHKVSMYHLYKRRNHLNISNSFIIDQPFYPCILDTLRLQSFIGCMSYTQLDILIFKNKSYNNTCNLQIHSNHPDKGIARPSVILAYIFDHKMYMTVHPNLLNKLNILGDNRFLKVKIIIYINIWESLYPYTHPYRNTSYVSSQKKCQKDYAYNLDCKTDMRF